MLTIVRNTTVVVVFVAHLLYAFGIFLRAGVPLCGLQYRAISLGLIFFLVFLIRPPFAKTKPQNQFFWYDAIFILITAAFTAYIVLAYWRYYAHVGLSMSTLETLLGVAAIVLTLETIRRTTGAAMVAVVLVFLLYTYFGKYIGGFFHASGSGFAEMSGTLWLSAFGMYGMVAGVTIDYVFPFLLFTSVLQVVGGGEFFRRLAFTLFGRARGYSAKTAIAMNLFFGLVSGSAISNVYLTGPLTIPLMKKEGYSPEYAGGLVCTAATASQITPPVMGIVAFVMADLLGIPYIKICMAAAIPAFIYFLSLYLIVDLDTARLGLRISQNDSEKTVPLTQTLLEGWHCIAAMAMLVFLLFTSRFSPALAVSLTSLALMFLAMFRKATRPGFRQIQDVVRGTATALVDIAPICAGAGLIMGAVGMTSLDFRISTELTAMAGGSAFGIWFFAALASLILGMGLPTLPAYIIVVLIIVPALTSVGFAPLVIHMFVFYFGLAAMVTPPICLAVYVAAPMAGSTIWRVGLSAIRLGIATYLVPFLFAYYPSLLLIGDIRDTAFRFVLTVIATGGLCFALARFGLTRANWGEVIIALAGACLLVLPDVPYGIIMGVGLLALVAMYQIMKWLRVRQCKTV